MRGWAARSGPALSPHSAPGSQWPEPPGGGAVLGAPPPAAFARGSLRCFQKSGRSSAASGDPVSVATEASLAGGGGWTGRQEQRRRRALCGHVRADGAVSGWLSRLLPRRGRASRLRAAASAEPPGLRGLDSGGRRQRSRPPVPGMEDLEGAPCSPPRRPHELTPGTPPASLVFTACVLSYRSRAGPWRTVRLAGSAPASRLHFSVCTAAAAGS